MVRDVHRAQEDAAPAPLTLFHTLEVPLTRGPQRVNQKQEDAAAAPLAALQTSEDQLTRRTQRVNQHQEEDAVPVPLTTQEVGSASSNMHGGHPTLRDEQPALPQSFIQSGTFQCLGAIMGLDIQMGLLHTLPEHTHFTH